MSTCLNNSPKADKVVGGLSPDSPDLRGGEQGTGVKDVFLFLCVLLFWSVHRSNLLQQVVAACCIFPARNRGTLEIRKSPERLRKRSVTRTVRCSFRKMVTMVTPDSSTDVAEGSRPSAS